MIHRSIEKRLSTYLFKGKVIILLGPRQVGKTTLLKKISVESGTDTLWLNGDESDIRELFEKPTSSKLKAILGNHKLVFIDEAQRITDIGIALKLLVDNFPEIQIVATGSSAFDLANEVQEPLTGRKYEFFLFPFSFGEMAVEKSPLEEKRLLEHRMVYGYYPEVVSRPGEEKELLRLISESYLYKDILSLERLRKPALLEKLLQALALQVGSEVSYQELGQLIGANNETVEAYISILEKTFVVFRLHALSRNVRSELKKSRKVYFWDNGVRNSIIKNFNTLSLRQDTGALFENYFISERQKFRMYNFEEANQWFWRTLQQQEIDYVEEANGKMQAFELKFHAKQKIKFPKTFIDNYPDTDYHAVNRDNYFEFLI
jgi:predicted AAA+ superfamily ATPase